MLTAELLCSAIPFYISFAVCILVQFSLTLLKDKEALLVIYSFAFYYVVKVTRLIPDAKGTSCNQRLERISGTQHTYILRVPFRNENGVLKKWISRFDVWPYLEKFVEASIICSLQFLPCKQNLR